MISFLIDDIAKASQDRPQGYLEDMLEKASRIDETHIHFEEDAYFHLVEKYSRPSVKQQIVNLSASAAKWVEGGMKLAPKEARAERAAICDACEFLDRSGVFHKCSKCGCCMIKLCLASESCPVGKWQAT